MLAHATAFVGTHVPTKFSALKFNDRSHITSIIHFYISQAMEKLMENYLNKHLCKKYIIQLIDQFANACACNICMYTIIRKGNR